MDISVIGRSDSEIELHGEWGLKDKVVVAKFARPLYYFEYN